MADGPHFTLGLCANCDSPDISARSPLWCSEVCGQTAEHVRYVRRCIADGRFQRPDVREAIEIKTAIILGGGYPREEREVPTEIRAEVFRRAGGLCERCGRRLDFDRTSGDPEAIPTIHHVAGNSSDMSNLRAFCWKCNNADARSKFVSIEPGSREQTLAAELVARWSSAQPMRLCDDENKWSDIQPGLRRDALMILKQREEVKRTKRQLGS